MTTKRNRAVFGLLLFFSALALAACTRVPEGVQPVTGFDAVRYMGTWYEVARLPNRFERGLERITATYSLRDDGSVKVVNRGFDVEKNAWREAVGRARFTGERDVAALKVSFFGPFYGGYNVVDLDPQYRLALVVGPTRDYLWILAREPAPPVAEIERLKRKAAELGYDTTALVYPRH